MKSDLFVSRPDGWQEPTAREQGCIDIANIYYPPFLKKIYDPPKLLFFKGNKKLLLAKNTLTVVGSRKTTTYHQNTLKNIISELRGSSLVIVSGLAIGIDGLAHRYALDNNLPTIAVLGSSLDKDKLYPQENLPLAREILSKDGLLLSEQASGSKTQLWNFPRRNRILAGLSKATVVISGATKSGTLITAQIAIDEGREVYALPGNINQLLCQGPNRLIKNGANLLDSTQDILSLYNIEAKNRQDKIKFNKQIHAEIYSALQIEPMSLAQLASKLNLDLPEINSLISELEVLGLIKINQFNQAEII